MGRLKHVDFEVPGWGEWSTGPQVWQGYHQTVLALEPVGYWRLGESAGVTAVDETGVHDGTYRPTSNGEWTGGVLGVGGALYRDSNTAASFQSSGPGWVELPFIAMPAQFTVVAWYKSFATISGANAAIFSWGEDSWFGHAVEFRLTEAAGGNYVLQYHIKDGSGLHWVQGSTPLDDTKWHHLAMTRDGATVHLYADGEPEGTDTVNASTNLHYTQIGLLRRSTANLSNYAEGTIDEVVLFDQVLSGDQIADLYQRGAGRFKPAP